MRIVGVSFNVYLSNRVGAETMGLYSLINSVLGFALTLATSGIGLAVTRSVAEANGSGSRVRAVLRRAIILSLFFGLLSSALLLSLSSVIAVGILSEPRVLLPLRLTALSLPAVAVSSALSGYFSAVRRVWKSAAAQLCEQAVRIYATASLLTLFLPKGPGYACVALVLGCVAGDLIFCFLSSILYLSDKGRRSKSAASSSAAYGLTRQLLSVAMPVAFSSYVRSGLTTLEHILIPIGLAAFGGSRSGALASYGVLNAMVLPVVLFPYAAIYSFTGLLVPEVAGAVAGNQRRRIAYIATRMWRLTVFFGLGCSCVMTVCSGELGLSLYGSAEAGTYIRQLAPLLPVMYLDTVTDALLKGIGEQVYTMVVNVIDALLSVLLVWLLLPLFGVTGYIAVLYISELINFSFSAARLLRKTGFAFNLKKWLLLPLACAVISSRLCSLLFGKLPEALLPGRWNVAFHILLLFSIFTALLRLSGALDPEYCGWIKKAFSGKK